MIDITMKHIFFIFITLQYMAITTLHQKRTLLGKNDLNTCHRHQASARHHPKYK